MNSSPFDDSDEDSLDPLAAGSASMPGMQGEGCLLRFAPDDLNDEMGADFSGDERAQPLLAKSE